MAKDGIVMMKYCFITDEEKGLVQLGVGCPDEYYIEIGMQQRDVQQSDIDFQWYLAEKCPMKTEEEKFLEAKTAKFDENDSKATEARTSKEFILTLQNKQCEFDTKAQTQADLLTAFAVCSQGLTYDGWICNNGVEINLTLEDVIEISAKFKELSNVYPHWNYYKNLIDNATTLEEIEAIVIDYDSEVA